MNESNNNVKELKRQTKNVRRQIERILHKLPQTLDESAREHGALVRRREVKSANDLLLALFMYAITNMSQRVLAVCASIIGIADMSDQAWQKKLYYAGRG